MIDTDQGQTRIRSWPRKRGAAKTQAQRDAQEKFRQSQIATRYISPTQMADMIDARRGTPILPRDILTSMLAGTLIAPILEDGRKLYPMAFRNVVSDSLDAISQTPGKTLIRGDVYWEEADPPTPPSGSSWTLRSLTTITVPTAQIVVTGLAGATDILCLGYAVTSSASGFRLVTLSVDNGATYYGASGDYLTLAAAGSALANTAAISHDTAAATARYFGGVILAADGNAMVKMVQSVLPSNPRFFAASILPVNAVRLTNSAGNLTGGQFAVFTR